MTKENAITKDGLVYDPETGYFTWEGPRKRGIKAGDVAGSFTSEGYVRIKVNHQTIKAHRLAWFFVHGSWPNGVIDHINGDKSDNRIGNLRDVNQVVNQLNRRSARSDSLTKIRGVTFEPKKQLYRAHIQVFGVRRYLGRFKCKAEAEKARQEYEAKIKSPGEPCHKEGGAE